MDDSYMAKKVTRRIMTRTVVIVDPYAAHQQMLLREIAGVIRDRPDGTLSAEEWTTMAYVRTEDADGQ